MKLIILLSIHKMNELICANLWFRLLSLKDLNSPFVCFAPNYVACNFRQLDVFYCKVFSRQAFI